jgi:single-stranded-DNA-specific exonuclease
VDGGAAAALLLTWLRAMGRQATLYIPDRIDEGYGPNVPAMQALAAAHDLILCVDCGTLSHEPIAAAQGCDVVVLDHHLGAETLPPALAVVNPNRQDEDGAGASLRGIGRVPDAGRGEPPPAGRGRRAPT